MKIDANDPKWTAYALGEITDAQEIAEIEKALEESPELRELVEDIRLTAGLLKEELFAEPDIHLTPAQKEHIEAKASTGRTWFGLKPMWIPVFATAAVLLVVSIIALRQFEGTKINTQQEQIASVNSKDKTPTPDLELNRSGEIAGTTELKAIGRNGLNSEAAMQTKKGLERPLSAAMNAQPATQHSAAASPPPSSIEAGSSTGTILSQESVKQLPLASNDVMDLVNVMGGVVKDENPIFQNNMQTFAGVPADKINIQRDGITVNDARYTSGIVSPGSGGGIGGGVAGGVMGGLISKAAPPPPPPARLAPVRINQEMVESFNMVLSPVDAEMGRGAGQVQMVQRPGNRHCPRRQCKDKAFNTEAYDHINDNPFLDVLQNPLSTFSIDVDTASYSNVRRFLNDGKLPPKDAVRIEELVNYFDYDYKIPKDGKPFAANFEMTDAPWNPEHRLLRIALKGREVSEGKRPNSNLVFLLDVSGSMAEPNKLPLVKEAMGLLVDKLTESDHVSIVVYASDTQVWLPSARGDQKERIREAIDSLRAGGSTNGASGIQLAYQTAKENFIQGGVNRIILCTDGDFNVGMTNRGDLTRLIEDKAKSGIYLSALGFGMGNYKDATLEMLANKGHGNYAYIDTEYEAKKVLVEQINSTLVAIAKDVKIQVEFNPKYVNSYRLIGYEDRLLAKEDFNDDAKEAGVIGAGHAVTALYELVPPGAVGSKPAVDPLKYQKQPSPALSSNTNEVVTVKIRSKEPEKDTSVLSEFAVKDTAEKFANASTDFKFAAAVAAFGMALRDSPHKGNADLEKALEWAKAGKGADRNGYRQEFIRLVHRAYSLSE